MSFLNSIFGNDELNEKIQELENSNLEMQKTIANLEIEKAKLESKLTPEMLDLESLQKQISESQVKFAHDKMEQEQKLSEQYDKYMEEISKQKSLIIAYNDEINELNSNIKELKNDLLLSLMKFLFRISGYMNHATLLLTLMLIKQSS